MYKEKGKFIVKNPSSRLFKLTLISYINSFSLTPSSEKSTNHLKNITAFNHCYSSVKSRDLIPFLNNCDELILISYLKRWKNHLRLNNVDKKFKNK